MFRYLVWFGLTILSGITGIEAQEDILVHFYEEEINENEIHLYADNQEMFPVSAALKLELRGMNSSHRNGDIIVLRPNEERQLMSILKSTPGKPWGYKTAVQYAMGNVLLEKYDTNYIYELPFERGKSEIVSQGYMGKMSHQAEYALDFNMPEGTPVYAMRNGRVVRVIDKHDKSCTDPSCMQFNNLITVQHEDGTYADYAHLKQHSSRVQVGDIIESGAHIADSGKTGWTTGPHLHIAIFIPAFGKRKTIPTLFRIGDDTSGYLEEKKSYFRY